VQRPATKLVQLAFVDDLMRRALDDDTISAVKERAAIVHFKDDGRAAGDRAELGSRLGAGRDLVVVREIVHRKNQRLPVDHEADSADVSMELQEVHGLGSGEFVDACLKGVPQVAEMDLNPTIASPRGAVAVDVRIRLAPWRRRAEQDVRRLR
jgi:hypothetical protein